MYYVNDGVYGSFNCILFDHATVEPHPLKVKLNLLDIIDVLFVYRIIVVIQYIPVVYGAQLVTVWIKSVSYLPDLGIGEWLVFYDMGAYTRSAHSEFNGFKIPQIYYYINRENRFVKLD